MNADYLKKLLSLEALPLEGGYFTQTYKSKVNTQHPLHNKNRSSLTCIYYLMTQKENSKLHRVQSDEIFHYYAGTPAELLVISPDKTISLHTLGINFNQGERPQFRVPALSWQSLKVKSNHPDAYSLLGATVSPGFEYEDFELGEAHELLATMQELDQESLKIFSNFFDF